MAQLTDELRELFLNYTDSLNAGGRRVLAVACKDAPSQEKTDFVRGDETDMTLIGCLAFLDPPKESAAPAIRSLKKYGVEVKILTGDNERTAACICREVGVFFRVSCSDATWTG